jgi:hypothetical protein
VSRRRDLLLAGAGFLLLVYVASRIGLHAVAEELAAVRGGIAIVILLSTVRLMLQTRSWSIALRRDGFDFPAGRLILTRLASQGLGYLTVLGPAASEPLKISLLRKDTKAPTAATLVDTGVYWFTSALLAVAGCVAACVLLAHHRKAVITAAVLALGHIGFLFLMARPKPLLPALAGKLGGRCPKWLAKAAQVEAAVRAFAAQDPSAIRRMFLMGIACQALMVAEVATVLWFVWLPIEAGTVLGIEAATRIVKMAAGFMPARIGADESGAAGAFLSFGLPAATGLALALARRIRDLLFSLVGLTWLAWTSRRRESSTLPAGPLTAPGAGKRLTRRRGDTEENAEKT